MKIPFIRTRRQDLPVRHHTLTIALGTTTTMQYLFVYAPATGYCRE